jgi:hypothetical protein
MKLSNSQQKQVLEKLHDFFEEPCDCKTKSWVLNDRIFELREFNGGNLVLGGDSTLIPVITVSCRNCGHTFFFNAILLGIITKGDDRQK